jgi:hypothetical protein
VSGNASARVTAERSDTVVPVRRVVATLLLVLLAAACIPALGATRRPRVTVIGDSVSASLLYVPSAERRLGKGFDLHLDLKVCRRLVAPSCSYQGVTPSTALQAVEASGDGLGSTVVIDVGYNDGATGYASDIDQMMRAMRAAGVKRVVWVTLSEQRPYYVSINQIIRSAQKRWSKMMSVADWASVSRGRPWFGGDGLHLNATGAAALAGLIRKEVLASN